MRSSDSPLFQNTWAAIKRLRLHQVYLARRDRYAEEADRRNLVYREPDVTTDVRARIRSRGYSPAIRSIGKVHTFAFIPRLGGNPAMFGDLYELGPVTEFDYTTLGIGLDELRDTATHGAALRVDINERMLGALRSAHAERPVDWFFAYGNGYEIEADAIRRVTDELGIPTVNMCLDDKQSWTGPRVGKQRLGQVDLAPVFDLSWTSARVACEWYLVEGGRPLYQPEAFDARMYRPMELARDIPVSFIGAGYGYRPAVVRRLRKHGIEVQTFGPGWPAGFTAGDEQVAILNRSVINLGMGGIGYSESLTNVKSRDFEIPGAGGGAYLTSFNADLAQHFVVGEEILCYSNRFELVETLRYYLAHPEEAAAIGLRARQRSLAEHRWLHRYQRVLRVLGILPGMTDGSSANFWEAPRGAQSDAAEAEAPQG